MLEYGINLKKYYAICVSTLQTGLLVYTQIMKYAGKSYLQRSKMIQLINCHDFGILFNIFYVSQVEFDPNLQVNKPSFVWYVLQKSLSSCLFPCGPADLLDSWENMFDLGRVLFSDISGIYLFKHNYD